METGWKSAFSKQRLKMGDWETFSGSYTLYYRNTATALECTDSNCGRRSLWSSDGFSWVLPTKSRFCWSFVNQFFKCWDWTIVNVEKFNFRSFYRGMFFALLKKIQHTCGRFCVFFQIFRKCLVKFLRFPTHFQIVI